jgi:hypothetical protein
MNTPKIDWVFVICTLGMWVLILCYFNMFFMGSKSEKRKARAQRLENLYNSGAPSWWQWGDKIWIGWQRGTPAAFLAVLLFSVLVSFSFIVSTFGHRDEMWSSLIIYILAGAFVLASIIFIVVVFFSYPRWIIPRYARPDFNGSNPENFFNLPWEDKLIPNDDKNNPAGTNGKN